MTLTDASRYARGARDDAARKAAVAAQKQWRVDVARNGHRLVDAKQTARTAHQLRMLHRRMSWHKLADELPCCRRTLLHIVSGEITHTSRRIAMAVDALWSDLCAPVETDKRRWPIEPFREAAIAHKGSVRALGNSNRRRVVYKGGTISTRQAEDYAESLGLMPHEIWGPAWYQA